MTENLNVIWLSNQLNLIFLKNILVLNKRAAFNVITLFDLLLRVVYTYKKLKVVWLLYYFLYYNVVKFYEIFFIGQSIVLDECYYHFSYFLRLKLSKFNCSSFLNTNLIIDINVASFVGQVYSFAISNFYILKSFPYVTRFWEYKGLSKNLPMIVYYTLEHEIEHLKILDSYNFNSNYSVNDGFNDKSEKGFYMLPKITFFDEYYSNNFLENENIYIENSMNFFNSALASNINLEITGLNFDFVYKNLDNIRDFTSVYANNLARFDKFSKNVNNYNIYNLGYNTGFQINNSVRDILTYLSLLTDRVNIEDSWTFIFDDDNMLANYHHIYSYFNEYWVLRNLALSDLSIWFAYVDNFSLDLDEDGDKNRGGADEVLDSFQLSWDLNSLIPFLNSAPLRGFSHYNKNLVMKKLIIFKTQNYYWLFNKHVIVLLQNVLRRRVAFTMRRNIIDYLDSDVNDKALFILKNTNLVFKRIYFTQEFADILIALGASKDPVPFANWLAKNIRETEFWKHWAFISYVRFSVRDMFGILNTIYNLNGIKIRFKGKIGNKGSFRKKKLVIYYGNIKKSNVFTKSDKAFSLSRNFTGLIGVTVTVAY